MPGHIGDARLSGLPDDRLEQAMAGSGIGIWELELRDGAFPGNRAVYANVWEQLGYGRPDGPTDFAAWIALIHAEDWPRQEECFRAYVAGEVNRLECEVRLRRRDGSYRWMLVRGEAVRDAAGKPVRLVGTCIDITERKVIVDRLRRSESLLADAERLAGVGSWRWDIRSGQLDWSAETFRMLGVDPTKYSPTHEGFLASVHATDRDRVTDLIAAALRGEQPYEVELRLVRPDGQVRVLHSRGRVIRDPSGEPVEMIGMAQDVTEARQAEERLRESESRLAEAQRVAHIGSWSWDLTTDDILWSDEHYRVVGLEPQSVPITVDHAVSYVHSDDRETAWAAVLRAIRDRRPYEWCLRIVRADGAVRIAQSRGRAEYDTTGNPIRMFGTIQDVTERKRAAEALRESEERFRGTFESAGVGIAHMDRACHYIRVNQHFCDIVGHSREELLAATCLTITHPDDMTLGVDQFEAVMRGDLQNFRQEKRYLRQDGTPVWVNMAISLQRDAAGNPAYAIEIVQDISDRKRAEEELRVASDRLDLAMRGSNIGIWDVNLAPGGEYRFGPVRFVNVWEPLGYHPGEFPTHALASRALGHPEDLARVDAAVAACLAGETEEIRVENRIRHKDGTWHWLLTLGKAHRDASGEPVRLIGTVLDITDRKEQGLRQHALAAGALRINASLSVAQPLNATLQVVTDLAREIIGAHVAETGVTLGRDWNQAVVVRSASDQYAWWRDVAARPDGSGLESLVCQTNRPVRLATEDLADRPESRGAAGTADRHPPLRGWLGVPLIGRDGMNLGVLHLSDKYEGDFTTEDEAIFVQLGAMAAVAIENWSLYQAVREVDRRKDEFLANVSHEIRTPMNAILGLTEVLLATPVTDEQRQCLQTVKTASDHMLGMINDLLDFSKIEAGKLVFHPANFSLRAALDDTLRTLASRAHEKGLELAGWVHPDIPDAVIGDAGRVRQVLLNLVGNAIKFTEQGEVVVGVTSAAGPTGPILDAVVRFEIRDTGIGIASEKQEAVFQPFEQEDMSTTRRYAGTGLGLTIAARLVTLMGGNLNVQSEPGRGSTFTFTARFGRQVSPPTPVAAPAVLRDRPVLIVDDSATTRGILEEWLAGWQMAPQSVADSQTALDVLQAGTASGGRYHLVLVDARMPDTDGLTLAARIRDNARLADTPIILLTAGDQPGDVARSRALRIDARLVKPVAQGELLRALVGVWLGGPEESPPSRAAAVVGALASAPLHILVAEDNEFNRRHLEMLLARRGYRVWPATTGREALARLGIRSWASGIGSPQVEAGPSVTPDSRLRTLDFDLLLLDLHMPELDGFEVARTIRDWERIVGGHLPVIALTARSQKEDRERCLAAGMDDYLAKPVRGDDLFAAIDRAVSSTLSPWDTPPAGAGGPNLIDAATLLAGCEGDPEALRGICADLRAYAPERMAAIAEALRAGDAARLRDAAHRHYGLVGAFSPAAGRVASAVEEHADRGDLASAAPLVAELQKMTDRLIREADGLAIDGLRSEVRLPES